MYFIHPLFSSYGIWYFGHFSCVIFILGFPRLALQNANKDYVTFLHFVTKNKKWKMGWTKQLNKRCIRQQKSFNPFVYWINRVQNLSIEKSNILPTQKQTQTPHRYTVKFISPLYSVCETIWTTLFDIKKESNNLLNCVKNVKVPMT